MHSINYNKNLQFRAIPIFVKCVVYGEIDYHVYVIMCGSVILKNLEKMRVLVTDITYLSVGQLGMIGIHSRKENGHDNACIESFFSHFISECLYLLHDNTEESETGR